MYQKMKENKNEHEQNQNQNQSQDQDQNHILPNDMKRKRKRRCLMALGIPLILIFLLFIIILILALTVFKTKSPKTTLVSASLDGVAPSVSLPSAQIELNITVDLKILVKNPNHVSFKHGQGKSYLLYEGNQVGEADIYPGKVPATGSATLPYRLTLEADKLASNLTGFITDVIGGQLVMQADTRIPGRINFLGIFKKHVVVVSECQLQIAVLDMNITDKACKDKTKF
ncbi:hypothetical protein CMV_012501 [Castanea mollissima]|uniref:Late embryogenesis abundant protein LEA-2 subgroup domain-containing protein n=1 Tax=Castanea mollissima TaxID=60419 RepID=A0A8J4REP5_9ROSI|nr:hypothetical protein CMV_012501 [Castanea mollissima]